tara:strand:+ start:9746 stop:10747 length:1002 start_codon:yes stop_codon:yes gene_type:complete
MDDDIIIQKNESGEDIYIFDPYNTENVEITKSDVQGILKNYGINVNIFNFELYKRAFIHRSYTKRPDLDNIDKKITIVPKPINTLELHTKSNERLEFIGDGVLECITKYYLYRRFPKENEGFMTEKKIALVKNESIGRIALEMGLHKWIILSKNAESKQIRTNVKKLGCLFEAFIGAMFLDFNRIKVQDEEKWFDNIFVVGPGFQMVQIFVETIFEKHVDWINLIQNDDNYKNILQVRIQKEFKVTPHYMEIQEYNSDKGYNMGVFLCLGQSAHNLSAIQSKPIRNYRSFAHIHQFMAENAKVFILLGSSVHKIKKKAEQIACENALMSIENY